MKNIKVKLLLLLLCIPLLGTKSNYLNIKSNEMKNNIVVVLNAEDDGDCDNDRSHNGGPII